MSQIARIRPFVRGMGYRYTLTMLRTPSLLLGLLKRWLDLQEVSDPVALPL